MASYPCESKVVKTIRPLTCLTSLIEVRREFLDYNSNSSILKIGCQPVAGPFLSVPTYLVVFSFSLLPVTNLWINTGTKESCIPIPFFNATNVYICFCQQHKFVLISLIICTRVSRFVKWFRPRTFNVHLVLFLLSWGPGLASS